MSVRFTASHILRPALIASLFGLAIPAALAQGAGGTPYVGGPNETVTVIAPHFRADSTPLNGPLERMYLSKPIRYTTRDLLDPARAQVLRWKVWRAAHDVCDQLRETYPVYRMSTAPTCFREAYNDAIVKIDSRITGARLAYWYGY
ncbi:MAG TPA: UrcA family protein [Rhizomicrobium sp.]|jgi:UrcA family protein|nr:UrcA family protein [Rhizomicrobium sp.]